MGEMKTRTELNQEELKSVRRMRANSMSWRYICNRFDISYDCLRRQIDPGFREHRNLKVQQLRNTGICKDNDPIAGPSIPDVIERRRQEYINRPHRDLTGAIMGDPKVGQSALDKKRLSLNV